MRLVKRGKVWHARYYDAEGNRRTTSTKCHDKAAAEQVARRLERVASDPDLARSHEVTLDELLVDMIRDCEERQTAGKMSPDSVAFYRKRCAVLRLYQTDPAILPVVARHLDAHHIDAFISHRRRFVRETTISKDLIALRKALKLAKRRKRWRGDLEILPIGFAPEYKPRERVLTTDEAQLLLRELAAPRAGRVAFALALGADPRDIERARREDVGADAVRLRGTKTKDRDRLVPLVAQWQRDLLRYALELADGEGDMLWSKWTKSVRDLGIACDACGIPRVNNKDLRRTFGTWLRNDGAMPADIAPAMGHADSRMVERVYGRLTVDQLRARLTASLGTDPPVRQSGSVSAIQAHSVDNLEASKEPDFGSSCWTRTSDPVINSPRLLLPKPRQTRRRMRSHVAGDPPVRQRKRRTG